MFVPKRVLTRRHAVLVLGSVLLVGCPEKKDDKDEDEDEDQDDDKKKKTRGKKKSSDKEDKDDKKEKDESEPSRRSYELGRKYAFACLFATLSKPEIVAKNMRLVESAAKALGIEAPSEPTKENGIETIRTSTIGQTIKDKHDAAVGAACDLGMSLTDAFFGTQLEADISDQLAKVRKNAPAAKVPESVYSDALTTTEGSPTGDNLNALTKKIDAHFKYSS